MVTDASALVEYLLRTAHAPRVEAVLTAADTDLHAPALCDVEVTAALRRALLGRKLTEPRARQALDDFRNLPLTRHGHQQLLHRVLALRQKFSAYDATYVALAEHLGAALLTADAPLGRAARKHVTIA